MTELVIFKHNFHSFFQVILSIDVGDGYPIRVQSTLPSKYTLCDNRWHNVSALYEDHQIVLRVDDYPPNTLLVQSNDVLRRVATKAPLYIGGLPGKTN